jgi:hypothetical protein
MEQLGGGVWGGVVAPLASAYVGVLVMLLVYARSSLPDRRRGGPPVGWPGLLKHLLVTSLAGYLVFVAIVVVFSFSFADQPRAIRQAITGGGFLAAVGLCGLALLGWVETLVRGLLARRRARSAGPDGAGL